LTSYHYGLTEESCLSKMLLVAMKFVVGFSSVME